MDSKRQGEIAIKLVKWVILEDGVDLTPDLRERVEKAAQDIGVNTEELLEFAKPFVHELVDKYFPVATDKPRSGIPLGDMFANDKRRDENDMASRDPI